MASFLTSTNNSCSSSATTPATTPTTSATAATTAKRLGYTSPSTSVICEEVFDDACPPSAEEINEYAALIGIEPSKEPQLLHLAKEGLMAALPAEWKICYSEEKSGHYYHNTRTKQSQWDHPLDAVYRDLVEQARQKAATAVGGTPIIDNSEDMSQLDSGIRSMQGADELLDDMSSPLNNGSGGLGLTTIKPSPSQVVAALPATLSFPGPPSGFSGGVSRFLESRGKNFGPIFQPVKNTRFEVAKTNAQISLAMKFATPMSSSNSEQEKIGGGGAVGGFQLSGTGAMFLKSRRQLEQQLVEHQEPRSRVKGILRDSSLSDMRRRMERDEAAASETEDKKSVRFNLEETQQQQQQQQQLRPEQAAKVNQSPELSINSEEEEENDEDDDDDAAEGGDDDVDEDDDVWDEDLADPDAMVGMCSLNPFISDEPGKGIRVISVPKAQTIQMLERSVEQLPGAPPPALAKLKLEQTPAVKPLYEDTDSDSKGSSVRSFIINKSEQDSLHSNNPFDLDELGRKHSHELEQLQRKLHQQQPAGGAAPAGATTAASATGSGSGSGAGDKLGMRSLKMASKLVGLLKQQKESVIGVGAGIGVEQQQAEQLQQDLELLRREHEQKLKSLRHEYDLRLTSHQHQLDEAFELQLEDYRRQLEQQLQSKRTLVVGEHKARMATLQTNHAEILQELERDLRSEEEILRREQAAKLEQMRDKLAHELELEKQRLRESGEERLYEKVRCEKRLLEDKYRCLKEKYVRLKTDVKLSLERRNRRREAQALQQHRTNTHTNTNTNTNTNTTTGSETERSISNKPSIGNSENRSLSYSEQPAVASAVASGAGGRAKPPVPPKTHLSKPGSGGGIASKYIKQLQLQDDATTSLSQSDTTISNNYSKGRYLPAPAPAPVAIGPVLSDNGNSDSEAVAEALQCNRENNNNQKLGAARKKLFSRTKSASTSRLNSDNYKLQLERLERPCTPVENLRHQLQKLEDLEDQFPEHTLDTTYHLRYPFTDISNEGHAGLGVASSELEFFKHRIHLERDSVRRAKESLRTQRTNFRARQREIKQRHKLSLASSHAHSLDQLIQEEKELTEMEVNLHRTRALLGEKVIRLRHLEQSLLRIYEKEKPSLELELPMAKGHDDATTLSDLSSHSSSGFSSTDFASGAVDLHKRKEYFQQESNECIQSLEILNAEIREILDILGQKQAQPHPAQPHPAGVGVGVGAGMPMISPSELSWSHMLSQQQQQQQPSSSSSATAHSSQVVNQVVLHAPQSIPTLADRLETYRQLAAGRMHSSMGGAILAANTIVSQSPRAVNYTTSLVERTRDLRNWLRQAKTEHELLAGMGMQHGLAINQSASISHQSAVHQSAGASTAAAAAAAAAGVGVGVAAASQANL